jgi:hypothetical protein
MGAVHYLLAADASHRIVLEGTMELVWHRPHWLWPLFWLLTCFDLLFPETGTEIRATMTVSGWRSATGEGYHTRERTFAFPRLRRFNAVMVYDLRHNRVVERLGPGQLLQMAWDIQLRPPATVVIVTTGWRCGSGVGRCHFRACCIRPRRRDRAARPPWRHPC